MKDLTYCELCYADFRMEGGYTKIDLSKKGCVNIFISQICGRNSKCVYVCDDCITFICIYLNLYR